MGELLYSARQSRIISKFFTLSVQNVGTAFFTRGKTGTLCLQWTKGASFAARNFLLFQFCCRGGAPL